MNGYFSKQAKMILKEFKYIEALRVLAVWFLPSATALVKLNSADGYHPWMFSYLYMIIFNISL